MPKLVCPAYPRYTFHTRTIYAPVWELRVGIRRKEDPLLLLQLNVGETLEFQGGLLCQVQGIRFSYTGRRAIVRAVPLCGALFSLDVC
jgi:hypothetical protein